MNFLEKKSISYMLVLSTLITVSIAFAGPPVSHQWPSSTGYMWTIHYDSSWGGMPQTYDAECTVSGIPSDGSAVITSATDARTPHGDYFILKGSNGTTQNVSMEPYFYYDPGYPGYPYYMQISVAGPTSIKATCTVK